MSGMMKAAGSIENRARRGLDVGDLERALLHAVGQDMRDLIDEAILVRFDHLARLLRQRQIRREHLGVVANLLVLDRKHRAQPTLQPGWRRPRTFRNLLKRRVGAIEPALGHRFTQRSLARKMTIDAAMADIERAGYIDDRSLRQPEAAQ